jgi:hypothetical protein
VRSRFFQFGYEYLAVARADVPAAYVEFRSYALHGGLAGLPVRLLLRLSSGKEALTMEGPRPENGDRLSLRPAATEHEHRLLGHDINLGPAVIRREIVRVGSLSSVRYAFRERIVQS